MRYQDLYDEMINGTARDSLPGWARGVLMAIGSGDSPVTAVRHPLGFLCLPLERTEEHGVCVHVWSGALPHAASTTSQIHSHSWDLTSFVLYGQVGEQRYITVVDDDAGGPPPDLRGPQQPRRRRRGDPRPRRGWSGAPTC